MSVSLTFSSKVSNYLLDCKELWSCPYMYFIKKRRKQRSISVSKLESLAFIMERNMLDLHGEGDDFCGASFPDISALKSKYYAKCSIKSVKTQDMSK